MPVDGVAMILLRIAMIDAIVALVFTDVLGIIMSSIVGHVLIGAAIGNNVRTNSITERVALSLFCAGLSIAPDLDYLPTWFWGFNMEPRYSHSFGGCFLISILGLAFAKCFLARFLNKLSIALIFLAPLSHIVLDFMVGVHKNPIFWPFSSNTFASNFGILPSAGRLSFKNIYLWRNLVIEMGVLIPAAILISMTGRKMLRNSRVIFLVSVISLFAFGYVAHGLYR